MPRDPEEIVGRALEVAGAALEDLVRFLGDGGTVEDLRQAWNRLLQQEGEGDLLPGEPLSATGRIASELLMAALVAVAAGEDATASPAGSRAGPAEPRVVEGPALLGEAVHDQDLVVRPVNRMHPVLAGVGMTGLGMWEMHLTDETYKGMWISPEAKVLLRTDHPTSDGLQISSLPRGHQFPMHEADRLKHVTLAFRKI